MSRETLDQQQDFLNILYFGEPKTGKTTASASMARLGKIVHVDAEAGLKRGPLVDHGIPVGNIEVHREITVAALDSLFWEMKHELDDGDALVGLVWDSISESGKKLLEATAKVAYDKAAMAGNLKGRGEYDVYVEDYGTNTAEMRHLARQFRDLRCHTAFVALDRRDVDKDDGAVKVGPDLTPRLAGDLLGFVDVICRCYTVAVEGEDEPEYWGAFRNFGKYVGGDRFGAIPPRLINPSFDRVLDYVNHDIDLESDSEMAYAKEKRERKVETPGKEPVEQVAGEPTEQVAGDTVEEAKPKRETRRATPKLAATKS